MNLSSNYILIRNIFEVFEIFINRNDKFMKLGV